MNKRQAPPPQKRMIQVAIPYTDLDFEGEIEQVIERLSRIKDTVIASMHNVNKHAESRPKTQRYTPYPVLPEILKIDKDWSGSYIEYNLLGFRMETDEEFQKRLETEEKIKKEAEERRKKQKEKVEEQEKKLYEKLKKKYGEG